MNIDRSKCCDCGSTKVTVHWGLGSRCEDCSDKHEAKVQADRRKRSEDEYARQKSHEYCRDIDGSCPDDGYACEECCDHSDTDSHCCLDCGTDLSESRMAAAYDYAKDARKYG
jgi:hypothetical protein